MGVECGMSVEQPYFCGRFGREDFEVAARVLNDWPWDEYRDRDVRVFAPVQMVGESPERLRWSRYAGLGKMGGREYGFYRLQSMVRTAAMVVYGRAFGRLREKFAGVLEGSWGKDSGRWREWVAPLEDEEIRRVFWEFLREEGQLGVRVETGFEWLGEVGEYGVGNARYVVDHEWLDEEKLNVLMRSEKSEEKASLIPREFRVYGWEELAGEFVDVNGEQRELLMENLPLVEPSEEEVEMIYAFGRLDDMERGFEFLARGVEVGAVGRGGITALSALANAGFFGGGQDAEDEDVVQDDDGGVSMERKLAGVRRLLEAGADVNLLVSGGFTPLWAAVYRNELELVRLLLEAGADVNVNCFALEEPRVVSSALSRVERHLGEFEGRDWEVAGEIREELLRYGAVLER